MQNFQKQTFLQIIPRRLPLYIVKRGHLHTSIENFAEENKGLKIFKTLQCLQETYITFVELQSRLGISEPKKNNFQKESFT